MFQATTEKPYSFCGECICWKITKGDNGDCRFARGYSDEDVLIIAKRADIKGECRFYSPSTQKHKKSKYRKCSACGGTGVVDNKDAKSSEDC